MSPSSDWYWYCFDSEWQEIEGRRVRKGAWFPILRQCCRVFADGVKWLLTTALNPVLRAAHQMKCFIWFAREYSGQAR